MLIARSLIALLATLLVGCGDVLPTPTASIGNPEESPSPRPDYVWRLSPADQGSTYLLVYDDAELLVGMRTERLAPGSPDRIWWEPMPGDPNSLELGWLGGVCGDHILRTARQGQAVVLTIGDGVFTGDCPAVGVEYQVVLTLPYPISEFEISVQYPFAPARD
jgi:hypothetical protein